MLKEVAATFGVNIISVRKKIQEKKCISTTLTNTILLLQGTMMHQMKRFVIDGNKVILAREEVPTSTLPEQKVDDVEFMNNEVYAVDVAMSTGEGKPRKMSSRTTIFKRAVDVNYRLKMKECLGQSCVHYFCLLCKIITDRSIIVIVCNVGFTSFPW